MDKGDRVLTSGSKRRRYRESTWVFTQALVLAALVCAAPIARAGEAAPAAAAKKADGQLKPIYHLSLTVRSCQARLLLNGFPLMSLSSTDDTPDSFAPPINPYLAGKRNTVEIEIRPAVRDDGTEVPLTKADFEMDVREYHKGGIVEPGGGKLVTKFSMPASVRRRLKKGKKLKQPLKFTHRFANGGGIDFSAELLDASPFTDREAVVNYAMHLRDIIAKGDVDGLMAEYEPKGRTWMAAYGKSHELLAGNTRKGLVKFIKRKPELTFGPNDVIVQPWCGGRIWELRRKGRKEFLQTPDGGWLKAFVGLRNGELRVVR
jgi:hypothetical protein